MMLSEAKITTKRQITIPVRVMKKLNIKPGDMVVFEQKGEHIEISSATHGFSIDDFIKKHSGRNKIKLTQNQINQARAASWGARHKALKKGN